VNFACAFGDYILNVARRELRCGAERIAVALRVFDLLVYLVRNRDRGVTKDDLIASVWGGRIVSESTLTSHVHAVRGAIGDNGEAQRLIRTLSRKGFRSVGVVRRSTAQEATRCYADYLVGQRVLGVLDRASPTTLWPTKEVMSWPWTGPLECRFTRDIRQNR